MTAAILFVAAGLYGATAALVRKSAPTLALAFLVLALFNAFAGALSL